jgi:hypothetical protein
MMSVMAFPDFFTCKFLKSFLTYCACKGLGVSGRSNEDLKGRQVSNLLFEVAEPSRQQQAQLSPEEFPWIPNFWQHLCLASQMWNLNLSIADHSLLLWNLWASFYGSQFISPLMQFFLIICYFSIRETAAINRALIPLKIFRPETFLHAIITFRV